MRATRLCRLLMIAAVVGATSTLRARDADAVVFCAKGKATGVGIIVDHARDPSGD